MQYAADTLQLRVADHLGHAPMRPETYEAVVPALDIPLRSAPAQAASYPLYPPASPFENRGYGATPISVPGMIQQQQQQQYQQ
eukprot:scaffold239020_cov21-Tisochrysis_lutea.AAC.1